MSSQRTGYTFVIILVEMQAALGPVSSSDKLELVDQLTDYVSDALAEVWCKTPIWRLTSSWQLLHLTFLTVSVQGSLADDELQYLFRVWQHNKAHLLVPNVTSRTAL